MASLIRSLFSPRWPAILAIVAIAGMAWGAKLMLIRAYGSDVPYMDQWDAQAGLLYLPSAEHHLALQNFWWPHNEHHVLLTRLANYGLTLANRQWDPLLEMSFNAALHAAFAAALLLLARRQTRGAAFAGVALVVVAVFALPFAWENTLAGFQSTFYFLAWAALGALWLALPAVPLSPRWWAGVAVGVVGLGSMSSGFLFAAAALPVVALHAIWCDRRWTWRESGATAVFLLICGVGSQLVNPVPGHVMYRVTSVGQWLHVLCNVLAWPANQWIGAAFVLQLPLVAFILGRLRARRLDGPDAVLLGLALWSWGQAAAVAYSRGNPGMGNSPRYYDLYAIGIVLNAIALARGWRGRGTPADIPSRPDHPPGRDARASRHGGPAWPGRLAHVWEILKTPERWYKLWPFVAVVWVAALAYGLNDQAAQAYHDYLTYFPSVKATERRRLADFIRTGDLEALRRDPGELPHPSADTLAHFLSHPGVRRLLSVGLRPPLAIAAATAETRGFARTPPDDRPGKPEAAAVWHAAHGPAKFVSEPLPADCLPVLRFTFAGDPELPPGALYLESADGGRTALQIASFRGDRWQTAHLVLPVGGAVRLVAELPAGDHWLAFADPSEMGRGSWYVYNLLKWAGGVFWGCAGLLALALATLGWREPPEGGWAQIGAKVSDVARAFLRAGGETLAAARREGTAGVHVLPPGWSAVHHSWVLVRTRLAPVTSMLSRPPVRRSLIAASLGAAFCVVLGARLSTIHTYGSDVPYMDQWDAEAWKLYMPYTEGTFPTAALFAPHNEHRVVFTRLINLGLTIGNRQWDPLLEMSVNALLPCAFALLLLLYARKLARGIAYGAVLAVIVALFALPLVWENTLTGFQSMFSLLQLSGLGALWLMLSGRSLDGRWWLGFLVALAGLGTMSSGFLCAPAILVALVLRGWWHRAWSGRDTAAAAMLGAYTVVGFLLVNHVPYHDQFRAGSPGQFGQALLQTLSWPAATGLLAAMALQAPWLLFVATRWRARSLEPADAVLLALGLWCGLQVAAVAYGRGGVDIGSGRYCDLYATGVIANALALARLWRRPAIVTGVATVAWLAFLVPGVLAQRTEAMALLHSRPAAKEREREHIQAFVLSGDSAALRRAPVEELPHPRAESLVFYLSHPGIRSLLPVSVRPALPLAAAAGTGGFARTLPDDLPGKPDTPVWRAARGPAKFVSEPLPANCLPVLRLAFVGSPELPPGTLYLESADGHRTSLQIAGFRGDRWQTAHLVVPVGGTVRLVAELPAGDHGLAFADPSEMGRASWYAYCLRKRAGWLLGIGAGLLAVVVVALGWSEPPGKDSGRNDADSADAIWRGFLAFGREHFASERKKLFAWHARIAAWPRPTQIAIGVVLLAIALFLRKPDALLNPQFWAEDGSVFFLENDLHGLGAWLHPYAGYLHLIPRMIASAVSFADPRWLPAWYNAAAFLIWVAVIARCWAPRLELPGKAWLPVAFLFAAHTTEVVFVLTNVIWITAFLLVQQVFMRAPATWWGWMLELGLIGIAALTGPFAIMLWPLFAWSFWRRRNAYSAAVLMVVTIACLIQLGYIWQAPASENHLAPVLAAPAQVFARITQRAVALCLGGSPLALALSSGVLLGIGAAVILLWLVVTRRPPVDRAIWYAMSFALVAMLAASCYRGVPDPYIENGDRYYFIPRVLLGWLLIWLAVGRTRWNRLARLVAVLAVCVHLPGYRIPPATDYHWAQHCDALRRGQPADIPTLPDGWILQYPGRLPR